MNDMKPELKLQLPTEAQWEYACRAGSTTPFCWGEQINSELVNFNGNRPYNNGSTSRDRGETVDVESFHQNDWGLWQMHGNVWEWCQNWHGAHLEKTATDFVGPGTVDNRTLRGGSWPVSLALLVCLTLTDWQPYDWGSAVVGFSSLPKSLNNKVRSFLW